MPEPLISPREEIAALRLARAHPDGARELWQLSETIRQRVVAVLADAPEVQQALGRGRQRMLGVELYVQDAGQDPLPVPRHAEASYYDYDRDVLITAVVDLRGGTVVRVQEFPGFQPPPTDEEVREAEAIAWQDADVSLSLPGQAVTAVGWAAHVSQREQAPAPNHRLITLNFWTESAAPITDAPTQTPVGSPVLVDLSTRTIVKGN